METTYLYDSPGVYGFGEARFWEHAVQRTKPLTWRQFVSDADRDNVIGKVGFTEHLVDVRASGRLYLVGYADEALISVMHHDNSYAITVQSDEAEAWMERFAEWLPIVKIEKSRDFVPVRFWALGPNGPESRVRKIGVNTWEQVRDNYTDPTAAAVDDVMRMERPEGGKLVLWHGAPGTGKTHCIRALAEAWSEWCSTSYVVDPEKFFGDSAYMIRVLLDSDHDEALWRLMIVEDADEFLVANAKERSGQRLSRLLNLSDGLLGQGLHIVMLITTNEPLSNIHEAVSREGRCLANIEFEKFSVASGGKWLRERGFKGPIEDPELSLAHMYNLVDPKHVLTKSKQTSGQYL